MASSVNKVIIVGNVGRDPELRYTGAGQAVANFSLATSEKWTDPKTGQSKEKTQWHRIVVWGRTAELCGEHLKKGQQVYVEGKLQGREWTNREGTKLASTEIVANQVVFTGIRSDQPGDNGGDAARTEDVPSRAVTSDSVENDGVPA